MLSAYKTQDKLEKKKPKQPTFVGGKVCDSGSNEKRERDIIGKRWIFGRTPPGVPL